MIGPNAGDADKALLELFFETAIDFLPDVEKLYRLQWEMSTPTSIWLNKVLMGLRIYNQWLSDEKNNQRRDELIFDIETRLREMENEDEGYNAPERVNA
jgi:hypothetical protein